MLTTGSLFLLGPTGGISHGIWDFNGQKFELRSHFSDPSCFHQLCEYGEGTLALASWLRHRPKVVSWHRREMLATISCAVWVVWMDCSGCDG